MAKKPAKGKAETYPRKTVLLNVHKGDSEEVMARKYAELTTSSELAGLRVIGMMTPRPFADELDYPGLIETLREQAKAVNSGDLSQAEAMLINQASALQALFVRLSERAMEQTHMPNLEGFMRLALRAQQQCRTSLETLAAIKNPPIVYARQANIANGPQQVNNGIPSRTGENVIEQNKQSGGSNELLQDRGTPPLAGRVNQEVEAVGEVDRAEVARG